MGWFGLVFCLDRPQAMVSDRSSTAERDSDRVTAPLVLSSAQEEPAAIKKGEGENSSNSSSSNSSSGSSSGKEYLKISEWKLH